MESSIRVGLRPREDGGVSIVTWRSQDTGPWYLMTLHVAGLHFCYSITPDFGFPLTDSLEQIIPERVGGTPPGFAQTDDFAGGVVVDWWEPGDREPCLQLKRASGYGVVLWVVDRNGAPCEEGLLLGISNSRRVHLCSLCPQIGFPLDDVGRLLVV